ncbi:MAG: class I SAM-dependent methyltransferase [Promethearchaeota archaeon]
MEENFRENNKKKSIIKKYNSTAYFYDKRYSKIQEMKYKIITKDYDLNGKIILDIGCGTGLLLEYLINSINYRGIIKHNYIGIDISWSMLLEFKSKISQIGLTNPILIMSDIENLPIRDNSFDSVFSITSFQNLPYIKEGIKESLRVSKKNADIQLSLLKKKFELETIVNILKSKISLDKIINMENLEDYIFIGKKLNN